MSSDSQLNLFESSWSPQLNAVFKVFSPFLSSKLFSCPNSLRGKCKESSKINENLIWLKYKENNVFLVWLETSLDEMMLDRKPFKVFR